MKIFTLGPEGSYSHQLTLKLNVDSEIELLETLADIFEAVEKDEDSCGVVPLENIIEGSVRETLDLLFESELKIWDIKTLKIDHCLCARSTNFSHILSHQQALAQCRNTLRQNYKKVPIEAVNSTSEACLMASEDQRFAAIASPYAAEKYGLKIIQNNLSDYPENETKFAIIHSKPNSATAVKSFAALIPTNKDEPGLLLKMLFPFQENNVNLSKLESRPNKKNPTDHIFFIEFEGDSRQARARKIFTYLEKDINLCRVKVLGGQIG